MKMLLVKTSSLGDVVHAMPAVTEARARVAGLEISWVVEESLGDIASLHPGVARVIPVAVRRWRRAPVASLGEIRSFRARLSAKRFDLVLDSQGLLKSALIACSANGTRHGFDAASARESLGSFLYRVKHRVPQGMHAVHRQKKLFGAALGYRPSDDIRYGLSSPDMAMDASSGILLLHGTTWPSKKWPLSSWRALARMVVGAGYPVTLVGGTAQEVDHAREICRGFSPAEVLARPPLRVLVGLLERAVGVVSVDTGLGHLAAALGRPLVGLYGATDPALTGMIGSRSRMLVSNHLPCIPCRKRTCKFHPGAVSGSIHPPCLANMTPEKVWSALQHQIGNRKENPA